jgi:hypothetical protein
MSAYFATLAAQAGTSARPAAAPTSTAAATAPLEQFADGESVPVSAGATPTDLHRVQPVAAAMPPTAGAAVTGAMAAAAPQHRPAPARPFSLSSASTSAVAATGVEGPVRGARVTPDAPGAAAVSMQEHWLDSLVARAPRPQPEQMETGAAPAARELRAAPVAAHGVATTGSGAKLAAAGAPHQVAAGASERPPAVVIPPVPASAVVPPPAPAATLARAPAAALAPGEPPRAPLRAHPATQAPASAPGMIRIGSIALEVRSAAPVAPPAPVATPAPQLAPFVARRHYLRWN